MVGLAVVAGAGCGGNDQGQTISAGDLRRIATVRPATPGWDWPEKSTHEKVTRTPATGGAGRTPRSWESPSPAWPTTNGRRTKRWRAPERLHAAGRTHRRRGPVHGRHDPRAWRWGLADPGRFPRRTRSHVWVAAKDAPTAGPHPVHFSDLPLRHRPGGARLGGRDRQGGMHERV